MSPSIKVLFKIIGVRSFCLEGSRTAIYEFVSRNTSITSESGERPFQSVSNCMIKVHYVCSFSSCQTSVLSVFSFIVEIIRISGP